MYYKSGLLILVLVLVNVQGQKEANRECPQRPVLQNFDVSKVRLRKNFRDDTRLNIYSNYLSMLENGTSFIAMNNLFHLDVVAFMRLIQQKMMAKLELKTVA